MGLVWKLCFPSHFNRAHFGTNVVYVYYQEISSLYSKKTPICHKIVGTSARSRKQVEVLGSKPVKPSNFDVRTQAKTRGCVFASFF